MYTTDEKEGFFENLYIYLLTHHCSNQCFDLENSCFHIGLIKSLNTIAMFKKKIASIEFAMQSSFSRILEPTLFKKKFYV